MDIQNTRKIWHEDLELLKLIMLTGFIKSTIGTTLIAIGITIIFNGIINPQFTDNFPYMGIIAILLGLIAYFIGDVYKKKKEEEHIEIIQNNTEEYVKTESEKLTKEIKKIVDEEEKKKEAKIKQRIATMEQGICSDVISATENAEYCNDRKKEFEILAYPPNYPIKYILDVARQKAISQGKEPTKTYIEEYLKAMYSGGWICTSQLKECLILLEDEV